MFENMFFSKISKYKVLDSENKKVGKIGDMLLTKDLQPNTAILFGSFVEEKLEDVGLREDIDELVQLADIEKVDKEKKTITLKKATADLETTSKDWKVPEDLYQFSKLKKVPVVGENGRKIGRIIDIQFTKAGYQLIIGGSFLEEFLESVKVYPDKDLIVPADVVNELSLEQIKLSVSEQKLKTTLTEMLEPEGVKEKHTKGPHFVPRGLYYP